MTHTISRSLLAVLIATLALGTARPGVAQLSGQCVPTGAVDVWVDAQGPPAVTNNDATGVLVVQLTDDNGSGDCDCNDTPDLVFAYKDTSGVVRLQALSGDGFRPLWTTDVLADGFRIEQVSHAAGNVDGDACAEVFALAIEPVAGLQRLVRLDTAADGTLSTTMSANIAAPPAGPPLLFSTALGLARFTPDGDVLAYAGPHVFGTGEGTPLGAIVFSPSTLACGGEGSWATGVGGAASVAVDLIPNNGRLELLAGNVLWDPIAGASGAVSGCGTCVSGASNCDERAWIAEDCGFAPAGSMDGLAVVAEVDPIQSGAPGPEVVLANSHGLWVFNGATGQTLAAFVPPDQGTNDTWAEPSLPMVAYAGEPGTPLIVLSVVDPSVGKRYLRGYRYGGFGSAPDCNGPLSLYWQLEIEDSSGLAAPAAAHADDLLADVFYRGETHWYVLSGAALAPSGMEPPQPEILAMGPTSSCTGLESPTIADIDFDGVSEVFFGGTTAGTCGEIGRAKVSMLDCVNPTSSRSIWNQLQYHVINVEPDNSIPFEPPVSGLPNTWLGQGRRDDCCGGIGFSVSPEESCDQTAAQGPYVFTVFANALGSANNPQWALEACPSQSQLFPAGMQASVILPNPLGSVECDAECTVTLTVDLAECPGQAVTSGAVVRAGDQSPPVISGVLPARFDSTACPTPPPPTGSEMAMDSCDPSPMLQFSDEFLTEGCPPMVARTWTATNECGRVSIFDELITVVDTTPPVLGFGSVSPTCSLGNPLVCSVPCGEEEPQASFILGDECDPSPVLGPPVITQTGPLPGEDACTITRTWTATDACGNASAPLIEVLNVECCDDCPDLEFEGVAATEAIDVQFDGVTITASDAGPAPAEAWLYDREAGSCGDIELESPDACSADTDRFVLVVQENGTSCAMADPAEDGGGLRIEFDVERHVRAVAVLVTQAVVNVDWFRADGTLINSTVLPSGSEACRRTFTIAQDVKAIEFSSTNKYAVVEVNCE